MVFSDFNGIKLSRLGFGCMRFASNPETGEIDQEKVNAMFDYAIANGVNYFDTAFVYFGGKSETAMAAALKRYPRENYYVADKFPGHSITSPIDNEALFNVSLKRCGVDYFDFYLLHNINESTIANYESEAFHIIPDMVALKEKGKIKHLGFSAHCGPETLDAFLTRYEGVFEFVQIQCNYLDWTLQNARKKYDVISKHGLPVWVMEPVRGGKLAVLPEAESAKLQKIRPDASDSSFSFRFLMDLPNIKVILSGMNEMFQVEDNIKTFTEYEPLSESERSTLFDIAENLKNGVPCTGCRYCCAGCPAGLDIPALLSCYNDLKYQQGLIANMRLDGFAEDKRPSACIGCGQCAHICPQGINVPAALQECAELYAKGPKFSEMAKARQKQILQEIE